MRTEVDSIDATILAEREADYLGRPDKSPHQGDYVIFADGVVRRVSHVWREDNLIQTSDLDQSSFYLGSGGYMSFSGGLRPGIPASSLTKSDELRLGKAWFFHHGHTAAHNGVIVYLRCFVWKCNLPSN